MEKIENEPLFDRLVGRPGERISSCNIGGVADVDFVNLNVVLERAIGILDLDRRTLQHQEMCRIDGENFGRAVFGEDTSRLADECSTALLDDIPDVDDLDHFVYLGSSWSHGLAQEAALKIREAAQAWSESYPVFDYRHGPIAVAHPGSLVWIFGQTSPGMVEDIEATGAQVHTSSLDPVIQLVQAQRLAVKVAESRGLDADVPRHLSRSVILR